MNLPRPTTLLVFVLTAIVAHGAIALEQPSTTPQTEQFKVTDQNFPPVEWVAGRKPNSFPVYGIYTWFGEYLKLREDIKKVGWSTVRIGGEQSDENMKILFEDGLNFTAMLPAPGKRDAFDSDEAYIEASLKVANEFLDRFGDGGSFYQNHPELKDRFIPFIMLRNEPNFHYMFKGGTEAQREALYAKVAPQLTELIKKRSPKTQVIGFSSGGAGAGDMRFVEHVLALAPKFLDQIDVFSTHPYVHPAPPETNKIEKWGSYSMGNSLATLRKTFAKYGRKDIPVWYTEGGWIISKEEGGAYDRPEDAVPINFQAAYSCRYYATALRLGVDCVTNMFITDSDSYSGGFFNRLDDMKWRPSAYAVQNMIRVMPHPRLIAAQADGENQDYIYEFKSDALKTDSPNVIMAYRIEGPKVVPIKVPYAKALITDMLGGTTEKDVAAGVLETEIGPFPVYVQEAK